jgi:hypothetical protein
MNPEMICGEYWHLHGILREYEAKFEKSIYIMKAEVKIRTM